jgi:hypothetical protein
MIDSNVVFPDPDGPAATVSSPGLSTSDTSSSAVTVSDPRRNRFVRFSTTTVMPSQPARHASG